MLLLRSPLRISFLGGGSDLPAYIASGRTGKVLSSTINKSIYLGVNETSHDYVKIVYSEIEIEKDINNVKHNIVRETLKYFGIQDGFELSTFADIPVKGTGMGSSSSFCVALVKACALIKGIDMNDHDVAKLACHIEIDRCGERIGRQDQYAAAFGGLNIFTFDQEGVSVSKPSISSESMRALEESIILVYSGIARSASEVLASVQSDIEHKHLIIEEMVKLVSPGTHALQAGDIKTFGELIGWSWEFKKATSPQVSKDIFDELYAKAKGKGAWGGKVLGAGGGGYLMVLADPVLHPVIREQFRPLQCFNIKFLEEGASIAYNSARS